MEGITLTDIDWRLLSDQQYKWLIENKDEIHLETGSCEPGAVPYIVALFPSGDQPTLLKLLIEYLHECARTGQSARRGIVVVEDQTLWEEGLHKKYFSTHNYRKSIYSPLKFSWERLERDADGAPQQVLKGFAAGHRRGQEVGQKDASVTKVKRMLFCTEYVEPFKIEKVWQTVEDGVVVTCCATSARIPFLTSESVVEVWGVNNEIDGLHVVDEVFHEGYDLSYSSMCFLGCELVGDRVDDDLYLICDWTDVHRKPNSWAAQRWRVENKGLYHVHILLGEDRSAGSFSEASEKIHPCASSESGFFDAIPRDRGIPGRAHCLSQENHCLSTPFGAESMCTTQALCVSEHELAVKAEEEHNMGQHNLKKPCEVISFTQSGHQAVPTLEVSSSGGQANTYDKPSNPHKNYGDSSSSPRTTSRGDLGGMTHAAIGIAASPSNRCPTRGSRAPTPLPVTKEELRHSFASSSVKNPFIRDDSSVHTFSSHSSPGQRREIPEAKQSVGFKDIWNMSQTSNPGSVRSLSRSAPTNVSDSKSSSRMGLGVKSSGLLDDSVRPKSPRVSDSENSPRPLQSQQQPTYTKSLKHQMYFGDCSGGIGRDNSVVSSKILAANNKPPIESSSGTFSSQWEEGHNKSPATEGLVRTTRAPLKAQTQVPSPSERSSQEVPRTHNNTQSLMETGASTGHPLTAGVMGSASASILASYSQTLPSTGRALQHKRTVSRSTDEITRGMALEEADSNMHSYETATRDSLASLQSLSMVDKAHNQKTERSLSMKDSQSKENVFHHCIGGSERHKVDQWRNDSRHEDEGSECGSQISSKTSPQQEVHLNSPPLPVKIPVPVSNRARTESKIEVSTSVSVSGGQQPQSVVTASLPPTPKPLLNVVLPIPVLQMPVPRSLPTNPYASRDSESCGQVQVRCIPETGDRRSSPPADNINIGNVDRSGSTEEVAPGLLSRPVCMNQSEKEQRKHDMQNDEAIFPIQSLPVPVNMSRRPNASLSISEEMKTVAVPSSGSLQQTCIPGPKVSFQENSLGSKVVECDVSRFGGMSIGVDETQNGKEQLAGLVKGETRLVSGELQAVCPEDIELSGLSKPTCSNEQMQHAAIMFRGRVEQICHQIVQNILSISSTSNVESINASQALIDKVGRALPSSIMQRGNYLYVVPRKLTPFIVEIFKSLDIPHMFIGGVVTHLFSGIDSVYKTVRVNLQTNQLEAAPLHLYQDLGKDAIKRMDEPLLAPRLEHDSDGFLTGKTYPGTSPLEFGVQNQQEGSSLSPTGPIKFAVREPEQHSCMLGRGPVDSPKSNADGLQSCIISGSLGSDSGSQFRSDIKLTCEVNSDSPRSETPVFAGFDVSCLKNKSNKEVAAIVVDRLIQSKDLMVQFMVRSIEDCGQDVFLDRFLSLNRAPSCDQDSVQASVATSPTLRTSEGDRSSCFDSAPPAQVLASPVLPSPPEMRIKTALLPNLGGSLGLEQGLKIGSSYGAPLASPLVSPSLKVNPLLTPGLGNVVVPQPVVPNLLSGGIPTFQSLMTSSAGASQLSTEAIQALLQNSGKMPKVLQPQLTQPRFMDKIKDYIQGQKSSGPLRKYQEECVQKAEGGENFIFVAPTGSGKTKIFVECSRRLLDRKPSSKIVVICPTVPLTSQQAACFVVEGFTDNVNAYSGENPLPPVLWPTVLSQYNVMVMTPQILCSILDEKQGNFHQIDLLVLDEIHHCRGEHPYSKLMEHYKQTPKTKKRSQVLGFTASPAKSSTMEQACADLQQLLEKTDSQCVVINEDNEEVQKFVPSAEEETLYIEAREEDQHYALCMGQYLTNACGKVLVDFLERVPALECIPPQAFLELKLGAHSTVFENWCKKAAETLTAEGSLQTGRKKELSACIQLLRYCNITLELVKEGGYEAAIRYIIQRVTDTMLDIASVQKIGCTTDYRNLLMGFYNIQPIRNVEMAARAFQMTANTGGYRGFPRYVALVRFLEQYKHQETFHGIIFCRTRDAVFSLTDMLRHTPALYFVTASEFIGHGRATRKTASKVTTADGNVSSASTRGMTGSQQRNVLEKFQSPGRNVLVSTRAAEEGINVTTCAFVVRYSVTETGIERIQSRGRTRVQGGKFVNIVEKESKEGKMFLKSVKEEATMNQVLKLFANAEHIQ